MSCLAIYQPQPTDIAPEPSILKFPSLMREERATSQPTAVRRARLLHENQCCPNCHTAAVDPIEINDALLNASLQPIPGTATIVAFHCNRCYHEWPAQ